MIRDTKRFMRWLPFIKLQLQLILLISIAGIVPIVKCINISIRISNSVNFIINRNEMITYVKPIVNVNF